MRNLMAIAALLTCLPCLAQAAAPIPATPAPADGLVYARPFRLDEGFIFRFSAERPMVEQGWILVIEADPALLRVREVAEPVLYVGDRAARVSRRIGEHEAGRALVLVPGPVDLEASPVWFGAPELPARVTVEMALSERQRADAAGILPFSAGIVGTATARGGETLSLADAAALEAAAREIHETWVRPRIPAAPDPEDPE